jgi:DNA-binding response OmpR family regulator
MRVLVVADDADLGGAVVDLLRSTGFAVDLAVDSAEADLKLDVNDYDCVVLDRGLPDGDGLALVRARRQAGMTVPVLALTAMDAVPDRVAGFDSGAEDYLVKPFAFAELAVRGTSCPAAI